MRMHPWRRGGGGRFRNVQGSHIADTRNSTRYRSMAPLEISGGEPLSCEHGTTKTATARFRPWLSGKRPSGCSLFARKGGARTSGAAPAPPPAAAPPPPPNPPKPPPFAAASPRENTSESRDSPRRRMQGTTQARGPPALALSNPPGSAHNTSLPLPSNEGTPPIVLKNCASESRPESGPDCLICAVFAQQ